MKCPHCGKELPEDDTAFYNVEVYGKPVVARTMCCEKLVNIHRVISFRVTKYDHEHQGTRKEDDWGRLAKTK